MRRMILIAATGVGLIAFHPEAQAIGCLSGGAAGALAGHMAGHGVLGALGGCIAGRAYHKHQMRQQDYQSQDSYVQRRQGYSRDYRNPWQ